MHYILPVISVVVLVFTDQFIKYLTVQNFYNGGSFEVIENFFYLTYTGNPGAAWGVFSGARMFFLIATLIILIAMIIYYVKLPRGKGTKFVRISLVMIASGAFGNFIDRLFRDGGKVVDMFHLTFWGIYDFPVFNFADILIVTGTILLGGVVIFCKDLDLSIRKK